jgi:thiamine biosynthesis protein ThiI
MAPRPVSGIVMGSLPEDLVIVTALDPELYLKSSRTQRRMVRVLADNIRAALGGPAQVARLGGNRLRVETDRADAERVLASIFGVRTVERVEPMGADDFDALCDAIAERYRERVDGRTFAVRARRTGSHDWSSQDVAIRVGDLLCEAGGSVDLTAPEVEVPLRVMNDKAYLTLDTTPAVGGLPLGTQGKALVMFSGGIDSPVATHMVQHRGVATEYLHFSLGCAQADHAAGIAHDLLDRFGAGTDPTLSIVDLEPGLADIRDRVDPRSRQIALKAVMYRASEAIARSMDKVRAIVNGESLGQVSTQTLDHLTSLDRVIEMPVLRPLLALDKTEIRRRAEAIGTYEASARSRELCDISDGGRVSVSTAPGTLVTIADSLDDVVDNALATTKQIRLRDWMPGEVTSHQSRVTSQKGSRG